VALELQVGELAKAEILIAAGSNRGRSVEVRKTALSYP